MRSASSFVQKEQMSSLGAGTGGGAKVLSVRRVPVKYVGLDDLDREAARVGAALRKLPRRNICGVPHNGNN